MRVFAIADLHLSGVKPKPMTIFGEQWAGHPERIWQQWQELVTPDDVVLLPGDLSWAMHLQDALTDLHQINQMPGTKVLLRGNHDYWWPTAKKLRAALPAGQLAISNDALRIGSLVVAGSRGWITPSREPLKPEDARLLNREAQRLELSINKARALLQEGDTFVIMLHYPPVTPPYFSNPLSQVIQAARPDLLVYGHLHGVSDPTDPKRLPQHLGTIPMHLVAADALQFRPKLLLELA